MNEKINSKCLFTSIISLSGASFYSVYSCLSPSEFSDFFHLERSPDIFL